MLHGIDLSKSMTKEEYQVEKKKLQKKLRSLHNQIYLKRLPVVLAFEGWDAGGKGGAIKRLTQAMDPRGYEVVPTASPNDVEKAHHYLWRFWEKFPKAGHMAIFDRTWYGRVLVERVEGFATESEWKRAYREINDMEEQITNAGGILRNSGCILIKMSRNDVFMRESRFRKNSGRLQTRTGETAQDGTTMKKP